MMLPPVPPTFTELLKTASLDVKHAILSALSENIAEIEVNNLIPSIPSPSPNKVAKTVDEPSCLVEHIDKLDIDAVLSAGIEAELLSLKLRSRSNKGKKSRLNG